MEVKDEEGRKKVGRKKEETRKKEEKKRMKKDNKDGRGTMEECKKESARQ